ncbi:hypothetical protein [Staphylococcus lugdunensis]|nr:hypothetical protein [Staphylococcus lugdunensis]
MDWEIKNIIILILQTPIIRDTVSPDSEAEKDIYGWEADITICSR